MDTVAGPILVVEDNEDDILLMLRSFHKNHFTNDIVVARDGEDALDYLLGRNGNEILHPMVILLDINLPKMNGLEVLQVIRQTESISLIPVVILTSSKDQKDIIRGYDLGVNSFLRKPVNFINFADILAQLGNYWLVLNEAAAAEEKL